MTRPPNERLDAEERALAALLPRAHGRGEPGPELDARILAAAQAATRPQPAARRQRRRSWIGPTAVAASLVLAVGLAWQLRAPPVPTAHEQAADAASAESDAISVLAVEAPPASPEVQKPSMPTPMVAARPMPTTSPPADVAGKRLAAPAATADVAVVAAAPVAAPPPAPPAPPVAATVDAVAMPQAVEPARAAAMAKARASETTREQRSLASGNAAAQAQDAAERAATDATTLDTVTIDDPGEDVPPATADSPEVRDAWLLRIGELLKQGKTEDAKASLAEFKRRYPDATLPPELRKLEP